MDSAWPKDEWKNIKLPIFKKKKFCVQISICPNLCLSEPLFVQTSVCLNLCLSKLLIVWTSIFPKNLYLSKLKGGKLDSEAFYDRSRECFDASKEILKPKGEQGAAEGGPEAS